MPNILAVGGVLVPSAGALLVWPKTAGFLATDE